MTDWTARAAPVSGGRQVLLEAGGRPVSFDDWLQALADDCEAATRYSEILAAVPWPAFFWEHPPLTSDRLDAPVEFVQLAAPGLARLPADPAPFIAQFAACGGKRVARFRNLGGDAELVAPRPSSGEPAYPHLAAFVRQAPADMMWAFWQTVAGAIRARLGVRPLWISTSGLGVAWLHVRLDSEPKYYQYSPYRVAR